MTKRLLSLLLVLAVAGVPVALELCQALCPDMTAAVAVASDSVPACHHEAVTNDASQPEAAPHHAERQADQPRSFARLQLSAVPHVCHHNGEVPATTVSSAADAWVAMALALTSSPASIVWPPSVRTLRVAAGALRSAPTDVASVMPLRI
ncbi:MAG: hypothetical protein ABL961_00700 [Vicinamibacterales bacterium]